MPTVREQILAAVQSHLIERQVAAGKVFRSREQAFAKNDLPAVVVTPDSEDTSRISNDVDQSGFTILFDIHVRGDPWDTYADAIAEPLHAALASNPSLDGLCDRIQRAGARWSGSDADTTAGALTLRYRITYLTSSADISTTL